MPAASRISVQLTGSSSELKTAVAQAADALKGLADVIARETEVATKSGQQSIRMNELVAKSYQGAAETAIRSARQASGAIVGGADEQAAASNRVIRSLERQGAVTLNVAGIQKRAAEEAAAAANASAGAQTRAAQQSTRASTESAAAAERSATRQQAAARKTEAAFGASSSGMTRLGRNATVGLLATAAASTYLAVKFQANTTRLQTQAGATVKQVDALRKGMLRMAGEVGFVPNKLADGMYHVVSSMNAVLPKAQRVSAELHILKVAAEGAQIGHSSLEETTYALASAMNALHSPVGDAASVMGQLNSIVGAGDMTMTDLLDALKSGLIPTARTFGVSLQSLGSALAVMGDMGMRGSLAGTRLRMSLALLGAPSEKAAKLLQTVGLSAKDATAQTDRMQQMLKKAGLRTTQIAADLKQPNGIAFALQDLNRHLRASGLTAQGAAALISSAFGGGRSGAAIQLMSQNVGRLDAKFKQVGAGGKHFGKDFAATTQTLAFQLHQAEANAAALGTELGTALMPVVAGALHDGEGFVHWLRQGSAAAHDLEIAVGTLATVAIGSYLVSKLRTAVKLLREFGQFTMHPLGSIGGFAKSTAPGALGGGAAATSGGLGGVWGARGPIKPGSVMNPLVVAMEAGEFAGLSSMGAAGTVSTERNVAAAETGAANMAGAKVALSGGTTAAEEAATAGMLGTIKSGLGTMLEGVMRGGMVAGIGMLGADALKNAIGGSTGAKVGGVAQGAAIGAGLGSFIGPEGTLAGGIAGALLGGVIAFVGGPSPAEQGKKFADKFTSSLPGTISQQTKNSLANATAKVISTPAPGTLAARTGSSAAPGSRLGPSLPQASAKQLQQQAGAQFNAYFNQGFAAAKAVTEGLSKGSHVTGIALFENFHNQLAQLPPQARNEAAKVMLEWAHGLVEKGKLPKRQLDQVIADLKSAFPGLQTYFRQQGLESDNTIAKAMNFTAASANLKQALASFGVQWDQTVSAQKGSTQEILANTSQAMGFLQTIIHSGSQQQRKDAEAEYKLLQQHVSETFSAMEQDVAAKQSSMSGSIKSGSHQAAAQAAQNFANLDTSITLAMQSGVMSTQQGAKLITEALNATLKSFGAKTVPAVAAVTAGSITGAANAILGAVGIGGKALGGFVGNQGERGRDMVPAMLGRGEAVLKHQDQQIVNQALANTPYGSLAGVFAANNGQKHYMAKGGYAGYSLPLPAGSMMPGSWSLDQGIDIPAGAGTPEFAIGPGVITQEGISGFGPNAPILRVTAGPLAGQSFYYGHAGPDLVRVGQHVRAGQQISEVGAGIVGISSGPHIEFGYWPPRGGAAVAPLLRALMGGAGVTGVGGAGGGAGGGAPSISAPTVKGSGAIAAIVRAGLGLATKAANQKLGTLGAAGVGAAGVSGSIGAAPVGNIMALAQGAAQFAGVPWDPTIVRALLDHESSGGVNEPPSGPLHATGPFQVIPSTFAQYAVAGHRNINAPWDNALAAFRYIKSRYGSLANMAATTGLLSGGYHGYAGGGFAGELKKRGARPGHHAATRQKGLGTKSLGDLTASGQKITGLETDLTTKLAQYSSLSSRFSTDEQGAQYLNPDGSLNTSGIAKKIADDKALLALEQAILGDYTSELPLVSHALSKFLGSKSTTQATISADAKKLKANKVKEESIRTAILKLRKPHADPVGALEGAIATVRGKYSGAVKAAERAKGGYHGKDKGTKHRLEDALLAARAGEQNAVSPLESQLIDARAKRRARKLTIDNQVFGLKMQMQGLLKDDSQLRGNESTLKGILTGAGGGSGTNTTISALEQVAGKLGTVMWAGDGKFVGIDTTSQGAAFDTQTTINSLQNDLGSLGQQTQAPTVDNSQQLQLLQTMNAQLAQALALNRAQTAALASMIPEIPHYEQGGPIMRDGLIYAHQGEHVVPRGGTLVSGTGSAPSTVEIQQHYHGAAGELMQFIDQRIRHPDNVRAVSRTIGQRTSMLRSGRF